MQNYVRVRRPHPDPHASLILRWKGCAISGLTVPLRRPQPKIRTSEDTFALIRRLAVHYLDAITARILNRQHRTTSLTAAPPKEPAQRGRRRAANSRSRRPPCCAGSMTASSLASEQVTPARPPPPELTALLDHVSHSCPLLAPT